MSAIAMHDAMREEAERTKIVKERTSKMMLGFGIASIVMMFGGLTSAIIVSKGGTFWVQFKLPPSFWISSCIIVLSSFTLGFGLWAVKRDKLTLTRNLVILTFALGIGFSVFQFRGYSEMISNGYYLSEKIVDINTGNFFMKGEYGKDFTIQYRGEILGYEDGNLVFRGRHLTRPEIDRLNQVMNTGSSYVYLLIFLHFLHLAGGLIYLIFVMIGAINMKYDSSNCLKIKLSATYWHFLGVLWIYLFVFFQFIH